MKMYAICERLCPHLDICPPGPLSCDKIHSSRCEEELENNYIHSSKSIPLNIPDNDNVIIIHNIDIYIHRNILPKYEIGKALEFYKNLEACISNSDYLNDIINSSIKADDFVIIPKSTEKIAEYLPFIDINEKGHINSIVISEKFKYS